MLSGGLFNRAEGLWQEIGADLFAATALEAIQIASKDTPIEPEAGTTGRRRKRGQPAVKKIQVQVLK